MKWKAWKAIGQMEKQALITATQAISAPAPDVKPHWVTDNGTGGHVRNSTNGAGVLTSSNTLGHQRPS